MSIPSLKRIRISTTQDILNWASKSATDISLNETEVMLATHQDRTNKAHVNIEDIREILGKHLLSVQRSYTLNGGLLGHVVGKA